MNGNSATEREYPRVETEEDLWCFLNTWGKLRTYAPRSSDERISVSWRKGYEQGIRDAMDALEAVGVTWDSVPPHVWSKWSGSRG